MKYQEGSFTVDVRDNFDEQGSKYTQVRLFSEDELVEELVLHTDDMEIVKDALVRYFDHAD